MKIELSECNLNKEYESFIVKDIRRKSENEYSIIFGEYELSFLPKEDSDKRYLKKIFNDKDFLLDRAPNITISIKKRGSQFLEGRYEVSEFIEEGNYKGTLEIHVVPGPSEEFRVYIIPEAHESIPEIFDKIFK
jgi:hypothetical protein